MPSEGIQGDEWGAYVALVTYDKDERGIAYGTRVLWRRRPRSSRRSNDRPGRTGKPSTGRRGPGDRTPTDREVCVMQSAETVLGVLRERGRRGLPCERTVSTTVQPAVVSAGLRAHLLQPGGDDARGHAETVDGMSLGKIGRIIDAMRHERYRFSPVRRVYIPKKNGKTAAAGPAVLVGQARRRGGAPAVGGVLRADVLRPLARVPSRPGLPHRAAGGGQHLDRDDLVHRGRHRRLLRVSSITRSCSRSWRRRSTTTGSCGWCATCSQAGYLEDWVWNATLSGAPQGGVASPILSNIYLHKLDSFVETVLIPEYTRGDRRARNPAYREVRTRLGASPQARRPRRRRGSCASSCAACPAEDPDDPGYRRLRYCATPTTTCSGSPDPRPKPRRSNSAWRSSCVTNSSWNCRQDKTLITHARTGAARFLGYEITVQHTTSKITRGRRSINGTVGLRVPRR